MVLVPPLRDRREDIPLLAQHFLRLFAGEMGIPTPAMDGESLRTLAAHPFPGNVRELKNAIERALIESGGLQVRAEHLRLGHGPGRPAPPPVPARDAVPREADEGSSLSVTDLPLNLEAAENMLIRRALAETGGNIAEAARRLGVNRTRIYRKLSETNVASE